MLSSPAHQPTAFVEGEAQLGFTLPAAPALYIDWISLPARARLKTSTSSRSRPELYVIKYGWFPRKTGSAEVIVEPLTIPFVSSAPFTYRERLLLAVL